MGYKRAFDGPRGFLHFVSKVTYMFHNSNIHDRNIHDINGTFVIGTYMIEWNIHDRNIHDINGTYMITFMLQREWRCFISTSRNVWD